jgi:hypothetical protein
MGLCRGLNEVAFVKFTAVLCTWEVQYMCW